MSAVVGNAAIVTIVMVTLIPKYTDSKDDKLSVCPLESVFFRYTRR